MYVQTSYLDLNLVIIEISFNFASCKNSKNLLNVKTDKTIIDVYI